MKRIIFLDTGYLIALLRKNDQFHAAAMEASELYPGPFLTTDLILVDEHFRQAGFETPLIG